MRFCTEHWDKLREAIDERGLTDLIAPDSQVAMEQLARELESGPSPVTYDPLMAAHWAVVNNVGDRIGPNLLYLMAPDEAPEEKVEGYGPEYEGRTWPRCPLCYLNLAHEVSCTDPRCTLDKEGGYDFWIDKAADEQAARVEAMRSGRLDEDPSA